MKKLLASFLVLVIVVFNACQRETSFESGGTPSEGLLQSDATGDCFPKTVAGAYVQGTALTTTNFISVDVLVTTPGSYTITSDTVNGIHFNLSGTFGAAGNNTINLKGSGTPLGAGTYNFTITYRDQTCSVPITVLPSGSGGPAVFTLAGTPNACTNFVVAGTYTTGVALNSSNKVTLNVNVTTIGTYTISTTFQGMTFASTGSFTATGAQTVVLSGTGTPTTAGVNTVPVTAGSSNCNFPITVGAASAAGAGTLGGGPGLCTPITVNGTYTIGTALTAGNTLVVQVNVTTIGTYSITTNTVNGVSFAGSGTFAATGNQSITLTGTGSPTAAGNFTYTVTFLTSSCTCSVTVTAIDYFPRTTGSNWSYEIDDVAIDSLLRYVIGPTHSALGNVYNIFMQNDGSGPDSSGYYRKAGGDYFEFLDVGSFIGYDNPLWVEYTFLKDNVANNTNWKSAAYAGTVTIPPNPAAPLTIRFSYTVVGKDVAVSVVSSTGTVNYTNVIVVEEKYEQMVAVNTWQDLSSIIGYGKAYYARGIGLIKYEVFDELGVLSDWQELRRKAVY